MGRKFKIVSDADKEEFKMCCEIGLSVKSLARRFGMSEPSVSNYKKRLNAKTLNKGGRPPRLNTETVRWALVNDGMTVQQASWDLGVTPKTIRRYIKLIEADPKYKDL